MCLVFQSLPIPSSAHLHSYCPKFTHPYLPLAIAIHEHNHPSLTLVSLIPTLSPPLDPMYDNDDDAAAARVVRLLTSVYFCYRLYSSCDHAL